MQFNYLYQNAQAVKDVNLDIEANMITTIIGPSGCEKPSLKMLPMDLKSRVYFKQKWEKFNQNLNIAVIML